MKPVFHSERPLNLKSCRIASGANASALASHNESATTANGWTKGKAGRLADLKRGWRAFLDTDDVNGIPDQNDVLVMHAAMYPDLPMPDIAHASPSWVWERIGEFAISIALDLGAVGSGDALLRYVNPVPHQVVLWKKKTINDVRWVKVIDPMHPQSNLYTGHWCKWWSVKKAALAIKDSHGRAYCEAYPIDEWTRERLKAKEKNKVIRYQDGLLDQAAKKVLGLEHDIASLRANVATLQANLADSQLGTGNAKAAGWESAHNTAIEWHQQQRVAGPPEVTP